MVSRNTFQGLAVHRRSPWQRLLLAVLTLQGQLGLGCYHIGRTAAAAEPPAATTNQSGAATVRLSFFNSSWPKVFERLAKQTGSELVMTAVPAGHFSRSDRRQYSRTDAVRILNGELEPCGFRILEQGRHLVVLHLESARAHYQRAIISSTAQGTSAATGARLNTAQVRNATDLMETASMGNTTIDTAYHWQDGKLLSTPQSAIVPATATTAVTGTLTAAIGEATAAVGITPVANDQGDPSPPAADSPPLRVAVPRHGVDAVIRVIYHGVRERAEFIESGPRNLPALRVYRDGTIAGDDRVSQSTYQSAAGSAPRATTVQNSLEFTVGIDRERQELVVQAPRNQQQAVARLVQEIDAAERRPGSDIRFVSSPRDPARIARQLKPAIGRMLAQNQQQPGAANQQQPTPRPVAAPIQGQPLDEAAPRDTDEPLVRLEGLRGPVAINDVPGIGLVVTGNQDDVDTVVGIIRELERVTSAAEADVQLLVLRDVNSQALAELLNNVYEELTSIRSVGAGQDPQVSIVPIVKPNAILVLASTSDMASIIELADELDQPVDPQTQFEVFALKSAVATSVVETLDSVYAADEDSEQNGLSSRVRTVADARTNSIIVQAAPRDLAEVAALVAKIDRDSSGAVNRMRVFPLKNAVAEELAEVISGSILSILNPPTTTGQAGGIGGGGQQGATEELQQAKSVVLELLVSGTAADRVLRSGLLADIRVTADPRVNSLIVTAPESSMPLIAELIRRLDEPTSTIAEVKIFTLSNSDASSMVLLLESLFVPEDDTGQLGIQVAGAGDVSSGLIPLRLAVDVRTNSIIATGGAEALRVVYAILLRLDATDIRERRTTVVKLKNSPAEGIAESINAFLQSQRDLAQIDPELVSNVELLEQEIIVVPEIVSNSLLISATPRHYDEIIEVVNRLDEAPAQVIIQVLIVEVLLENTDEFGVELGFQDSLLFDRSLTNPDNFTTITETDSTPATGIAVTTQQIISQELLPGFNFNNQSLGNNKAINARQVGSQGLSNFSLGRINGDLGFGGLVLSASSSSVSMLIRALAARRKVQILSRPQIRTVDNQLAQIQQGQQVPVVSGVTTNALGGITPVLGTPQQVGIILQVTPRITPEGIIVMETIANKSAIAGQGVPIITDPTTGAVVESPIFDLTEARATVAVADGQTIVLGGMITSSDDTFERKVPILGDIPLIKNAFRYDAVASRRTELLIFMTPRIIRDSCDNELIKQVESERLHFSETEAEEIHGPLYGVPACDNCQGELLPGSIQPGSLESVPLPSPAGPQLDMVPPQTLNDPAGQPVQPILATHEAGTSSETSAVSTTTHTSRTVAKPSTAAKFGGWLKNRLP